MTGDTAPILGAQALVDEFNRWEPPTGKPNMRELHGVADATKVQTTNETDRYTVSVEDGHGLVILSIAGMTYPAGLSPERARFIGECLVKAASRVEAKAPPIDRMTHSARSRST